MLAPSADANAPATTNTPITILSPSSGGDATAPGGETPPGDTPAEPGDDGGDGGGDNGSTPSAGGRNDGGPADGAEGGPAEPSGGRQGEFDANPSPGTGETGLRRELGALAGTLPFTGLMLWLVALAGLLAIGAGTTGTWAAATR